MAECNSCSRMLEEVDERLNKAEHKKKDRMVVFTEVQSQVVGTYAGAAGGRVVAIGFKEVDKLLDRENEPVEKRISTWGPLITGLALGGYLYLKGDRLGRDTRNVLIGGGAVLATEVVPIVETKVRDRITGTSSKRFNSFEDAGYEQVQNAVANKTRSGTGLRI